MSEQIHLTDPASKNHFRTIAAASLMAIGSAFLLKAISQFLNILPIRASLRQLNPPVEILRDAIRQSILWGFVFTGLAIFMLGGFMLLARHLPRDKKLGLAVISLVLGLLVYPVMTIVLFYVWP
jgi:hypothetical protein